MTKHTTNSVFTPTSQAKLTFVERDESINSEIVDALMTPGKQMILYGHSGTGKSTLIVNKLNQTYESVIISRCTNSSSFESLLLDSFDQLEVYYTDSKINGSNKSISGSLKSSYSLINAQIQAGTSSSESTTAKRIVPPQLNAQRLAQFLGAAKCCWVVEDFHKLKDEEKVHFSQNMKVFVDTATQFPDVKMIAIGAVGTAREVVEYDSELSNRVSEILVPVLSKNELHQILEKGEKLLNIEFEQQVKNKIVEFSNGLGSICHQLALNICFSYNLYQTSDELLKFKVSDLKIALEKFIKSNSDTLKGRFERATKVQRERTYNNGRIILKALTKSKKDGTSHAELLAIIKQEHDNYPPANLTSYLKKLQENDRGNIVFQNLDNGLFTFSDPFIKTYAQCVFDSKDELEEDPKEIERQVTAIFEKFVERMTSKN